MWYIAMCSASLSWSSNMNCLWCKHLAHTKLTNLMTVLVTSFMFERVLHSNSVWITQWGGNTIRALFEARILHPLYIGLNLHPLNSVFTLINLLHESLCRSRAADSLSQKNSPDAAPLVASTERNSVTASNLSFTARMNVNSWEVSPMSVATQRYTEVRESLNGII